MGHRRVRKNLRLRDLKMWRDPCEQCGHKFEVGQTLVHVDMEVTFMRGDDVVFTLCEKCAETFDLPDALRICDRQETERQAQREGSKSFDRENTKAFRNVVELHGNF